MHEVGRVVFFCGVGVSHPARLSGFKGLKEAVLRTLNAPKSITAGSRQGCETVLRRMKTKSD